MNEIYFIYEGEEEAPREETELDNLYEDVGNKQQQRPSSSRVTEAPKQNPEGECFLQLQKALCSFLDTR